MPITRVSAYTEDRSSPSSIKGSAHAVGDAPNCNMEFLFENPHTRGTRIRILMQNTLDKNRDLILSGITIKSKSDIFLYLNWRQDKDVPHALMTLYPSFNWQLCFNDLTFCQEAKKWFAEKQPRYQFLYTLPQGSFSGYVYPTNHFNGNQVPTDKFDWLVDNTSSAQILSTCIIFANVEEAALYKLRWEGTKDDLSDDSLNDGDSLDEIDVEDDVCYAKVSWHV